MERFEVCRERRSRNVLHDEARRFIFNFVIEHLNDVGVLKFGNDFRFALEAAELFRVPFHQAAHDFDSDLSERLVVALVDFRHSPAGYEFFDVDLAERFTSPVCHAENYNLERLCPVYNAMTLSFEVT